MLDIDIKGGELHFGASVTMRFMRTLRIPDDGREYPLPPGLGEFPIFRVADYGDRVPASWRKRGGVFIPMYQREALWIDFTARHWKPNAVKVGIGRINAISGEQWNETLCADPQDYMVVPDQPWLDGINAGDGFIEQFVAMPLGAGCTVEAQLTGKEEFGGIQLMVFEPKPGRFPDQPPLRAMGDVMYCCCEPSSSEMGLGAGGRMRQKIYPDQHGLDTWDLANFSQLQVHIANSRMFQEITGRKPPETPVSCRDYIRAGLPWFDLYDEDQGDVPAPARLRKIKSVKDLSKWRNRTADVNGKV
jgi:hypothetical protein